MASIAWLAARTITGPATAAAAATAVVIMSALVIWSTRRDKHINGKVNRMQRQVANVTGELSALRDDTECRLIMQRIWATDRDKARALFGPNDDNGSFRL
jgi:hypothetical protein